MEIDRAAGALVALRRCGIDEAFDEIVDASKRHRIPPLRIARALVALAGGTDHDDGPAIAAARYEWGSLIEPTVVAS
jgi:hypothetical protein